MNAAAATEPRWLPRGARRSVPAVPEVGCRVDLSSWAKCGGSLRNNSEVADV